MEHQFCTFYLAGFFYGVEVEQVQEIIRQQEITPVPLAPEVVAGLINLRGQIVTAFDLRSRLGLSARGADERPTNVVVRHDGEAVSLLVDEIGDVVEVSDDSFEAPPDTLHGEARALTRGVYKLPGKLMHALDLDTALLQKTSGRARKSEFVQ